MRIVPRSSWFLFVCVGMLLMSGTVYGAAPQIGGKWEMQLVGITDQDPVKLSGDGILSLDISHYTDPVALNVNLKAESNMADHGGLVLRIDQAYVDYMARDYDLRFGKQRVNWGTAIGFNPTDVINPMDTNDPMNDKLASWAMKGQYYWGPSLELTGVYLPFFHPSVDVIPGNPNIPVVSPDDSDSWGEWAVKLGGKGIEGMDFSVMYFSGWESMPSLRMTPKGPQGYYRVAKTVGADFATAIGDLGLWAEAAHTTPEGGNAYTNWAVGGDYGLPNGLKVGGQFFRQANGGVERDYVMLGFEQELAVIYRWKAGAIYDLESGDYLFNPEVSLSLADGADLTLGWKKVAHDKNNPAAKNLMSQMESGVYMGLTMNF